MRIAILTALLVAVLATPAQASGPEDTIRERAAAHGVSGWVLTEVAFCESSLNARAVGDRGASLGLFQLNTLRTGLWQHFRALGYRDAFNAWESSDYVARVASGQFADQGITLWRWSCYRMLAEGRL